TTSRPILDVDLVFVEYLAPGRIGNGPLAAELGPFDDAFGDGIEHVVEVVVVAAGVAQGAGQTAELLIAFARADAIAQRSIVAPGTIDGVAIALTAQRLDGLVGPERRGRLWVIPGHADNAVPAVVAALVRRIVVERPEVFGRQRAQRFVERTGSVQVVAEIRTGTARVAAGRGAIVG